jgi:competence protein ComEA
MVEVQGAVSVPGIYRFSPGSRVYHALQTAEGPTASAEIRDLNIAARLIDGSVLTVPFQPSPGQQAQPTAAQLNTQDYTRSGWTSAESRVAPSGKDNLAPNTCVNLNTANQQELERLPGVGPKTALKIIQFREHQAFSSVEDLRDIRGFGEKRLESLHGLVCAP